MIAKKLPYKEIKLLIPVLKTGVLVMITRDTARASKNVHKWFKEEFEEWDSISIDGKTLSKEGYMPIIWLREIPKDPYTLACLYHEVNHAVDRILDRIKVPLNYTTEEVYNYLGEYIFHEILKRTWK